MAAVKITGEAAEVVVDTVVDADLIPEAFALRSRKESVIVAAHVGSPMREKAAEEGEVR